MTGQPLYVIPSVRLLISHGQDLKLAYAGRKSNGKLSLDGAAAALPLRPSSRAHLNAADAGSSQIGLRAPDAAARLRGMAGPKEPGSPSESGSPTFRLTPVFSSMHHH